MSTYRLDKLFSPRSVAVVGASPRAGSVGRVVLNNLRVGGFEGPIHLVNPRHAEIDGVRAVKSLTDLASPPDVVVVTVPPNLVPSVVALAAETGAATAIVITAGLGHGAGSLAEACEKAARAGGLRLVGPNCLGVMAPPAKLNATFAARIKPVVVVKSGRHRQGAAAAATHTGALAGADAVYDAAFRRAGLLRVLDLDELFAAAETLGRLRSFAGKRLAILTNGGGIGVLAVDRLTDLGGTLAGLSPETVKRLDAALPPIWSRANPVDIAGDADGSRYAAALDALLGDPANDAILVMNVPTALASATDAAKSVVAVAQKHRNTIIQAKPVFAIWVRGNSPASEAFEANGIPSYATEADAVGGFMHLVRYREAIEALMATPPSLPEE